MPNSNSNLEKRLWNAADQLRANSGLTAHQYSIPVLGLIFLKFADTKFSAVKAELEESFSSKRREISKTDFQAKGVIYL